MSEGGGHAGNPVQVIEKARLPVFSWASALEEGALRQALNCANHSRAFHHVAVMADGHQGYGVPIGAVIALEDALSPYAVGNDIGCGMALLPTSLTTEELLAPLPGPSGRSHVVARDDIMERVQASIPSGPDRNRDGNPDTETDLLLRIAFGAMDEGSASCGVRLSTNQSAHLDRAGRHLTLDELESRGRSQLGTLGSGNHFIELLAGPDGDVWVLVHSGSRGVGGLICANFHRMALAFCASSREELPDPGLAWLPISSSGTVGDPWTTAGSCYERALRAALGYAEMNRTRMLEAVATILERRFPKCMEWDHVVNIHHNDATLEDHYGRTVWIHRKGAVKADQGTPTVTPGSMGTGSVLGRGLGERRSFCSCAHGAGRQLSRSRARNLLDLTHQLALIEDAGGKVFAASKQAVLDEMPGAYKDLEEVMGQQGDLVEPVRRFRPLATYKGSEDPGRRKRMRWRPEEER